MTENKTKILVVDDDLRLRDLLNRYLTEQGFSVHAVADATAMDKLLARERYDLIVLDLMMPGEDGLSVCRRLRGAEENIPIIMLTAKGDDVDRIVGLEMGADDYLPKPFNPRELVARIHAVLRRRAGAPAARRAGAETEIRVRPFRFNLATRSLTRDGEDVPLTTGEFALLKVLLAAPARAAVARQADGTRARPRIRSVRPRHRRADLAPAQAGRARSRRIRSTSRPYGASATCSCRTARA